MAIADSTTLGELNGKLEGLLARLTLSVGYPVNRVRIRQVLAQAEREIPSSTPDGVYQRFVLAARLLGVRLHATTHGRAEVIALVDEGAPVLVWHPEEPGSGLLLVDREGSRVRVAAPTEEQEDRWISESELPAGNNGDGRQAMARWLLAQPVLAYGTSGHGGHDHGDGDDDHGGGGHGDGDDHGHGRMPPLNRLLHMLRPESRDIWLIVLFALGIGILSLATPIAVEALITSVKGGIGMRTQVLVLALLLLFCLGLAAGMRALSAYVVELIQQRFFVRVVGDLAYRLPRASLPAFDRQNGLELVNRFFDVLTVQKAGAVLLLDGVSVVIQAAVGLLILGFYHPFLLGFDLVLLATVCFIVFVLGRGAVRTSIQESLSKYAVAGWLEEMVRHPQTFKHAGGCAYAMDRADGLASKYLRHRQTHFRILFRQVLFALGLQALASAALLGLGGWLVIPDESGRSALDVGQLVAAELIVVVIVGSLVKLGKSLESYYDLLAASDKLGHLMDLPLERETGEDHPRTGPASLRLRHVDYSFGEDYPHGPAVLDAIDATIPAGSRVAITGPSGSGKSTLVELIYGLREPTHGSIELDGVDLRDIRLDVLREQVVLTSWLEIFDGTIADNVRVGRLEYSLADVRAALHDVGLLHEIQEFHDGLNTHLTPTGNPLSLGQARRLLLARALLGKPRLLLLDESLDDLDEQTRHHLLDLILAPDAPWTVIVITHQEDIAARCPQRIRLHPHGVGPVHDDHHNNSH